MTKDMRKEFRLEEQEAAELLRDVADALENEEQVNIDLGDSRLMQPLGGKIPLRIFQDEEGTEIGFRLRKQD
jgi:hypothetical protein